MTMLTNGTIERDADYVFEFCDIMSLMNDGSGEETVQKSPRCSCNSVTNNGNNTDEIGFIPRDNFDISNSDIDNLSDKFGSIELIHTAEKDTIRYGEFEALDGYGIDINGSAIQCRGPCIDVKKVYKKDDDGDTLLHIALIILAPELAYYFINMSPHFTWLNLKNKLSQTPLHLAVLTNQVSLVRRLVVGGADIESRDRDGNMAIHIACRDNLLNVVRALLEPVRYDEQKQNNYDIPFQKIPQYLEAKNYEGYSCLHIASLLNHFEIVKTLLDDGADVNVRAEKSGRTVLHDAAWSGNLNLVKYLISLGIRCNINAKTYDGYTAFDLARSRRHWSIVIELATAGAKCEDEEME